jgi:hypothetical protein
MAGQAPKPQYGVPVPPEYASSSSSSSPSPSLVEEIRHVSLMAEVRDLVRSRQAFPRFIDSNNPKYSAPCPRQPTMPRTLAIA